MYTGVPTVFCCAIVLIKGAGAWACATAAWAAADAAASCCAFRLSSAWCLEMCSIMCTFWLNPRWQN